MKNQRLVKSVRTFLVVLGLLIPAATAAAPANFSGQWKLDSKRSDDLQSMLKLCGVGFLERKLAAQLAPTLTIRHDAERMVVVNENEHNKSKMTTRFDGKPQQRETSLGRMTVSTRWARDYQAIHDESVTVCKRNGVKLRMVTTRRFAKSGGKVNRDEMVVLMSVTTAGHKPKRFRRIFVRTQ